MSTLPKRSSGLKAFFKKSYEKNSSSDETSISRTSSISSLRNFFESNSYGSKVDVLGTGVSGKVELYYKKQTKELFAVKTFNAKESYETKEEYQNRCFKEFEVINSLPESHVNILKEYKFKSGLSSNQIVLEFVPYSVLRIIQVVKPREEEVLCFFRQVCEGIQFLHRHYIAHRDLKMENLMLDKTGTVKIVDFGAAFYFGKEKLPASGLVGTEALISPEAFKQLKYDSEANDVWSLGVLLYSMMNFSFPWKTSKESDPEFKQFLENRSSIKKGFPEECWSMVSEILEPALEKRIGIDSLVQHVSELTGPHTSCTKLHRVTLKSCARRFTHKIDI